MKRTFIATVLAALTLIPSGTMNAKNDKEAIKEIANRVTDWQIANFTGKTYTGKNRVILDWANGALFRGMVEWSDKTGYQPAEDFVMNIGKKTNWQMARRLYHADDICVGQAFLLLYEKYKDESMFIHAKERADSVIALRSYVDVNIKVKDGQQRWCWCDALFMAPPVYAMLTDITGDKKYVDFMKEEFVAATNRLFNEEYGLYFRDANYFNKKEENGHPVLWGRGNGWCYAGLTFLLETLPQSDPMYDYFKGIYLRMTEAVLKTQDENGSWHTSLFAPEKYPTAENSASGFMTYGLAWGVNHGILEGKVYRKAAEKGWKALCSYVREDGKLEYVQPVAGSPYKIKQDMTEVYGVGAFLLAATEMLDF
ncbi:MAG: glycoside hydrolase family 88 protein [Bacteroidales bacterium]|nr:glycoside hydrolase family 88 protein [Bacteroidales bacterium]